MNQFILFLGSLFLVLSVCNTNTFAQKITVDLSKEYQTIRGFGGMSHTTWISDLNEDNREKAFGNQPGEMGLSILRIHLDPNPDNFNRELASAKHAIQMGAIVFATPWNAPTNVLDPNSAQSRVLPEKYSEYVKHLNAFNTYMKNNGAPLYAISVQNEPDYGEWTRWTSTEMLNFVKNYAQDIDNLVIAPESFQFKRAYSDPLLNDANAAANFEIVGGHIYGGGLFDYPLARTKGKEVWMTEHLLGSDAGEINDWNLAMVVGKEINDCMKANFNTYIWWYIRRYYGLITEDGNITDKGYVISQFSKFIRPGAVRVDVDDKAASLVDVTAYKTDTTFVMVVVNRNNKEIELNFDMQNSNYTTLSKFATSDSKKIVNDGEVEITGNAFTASFDAKSITTFTSNATGGGKSGNIKPIANAGEDFFIANADGSGEHKIILDASLSSDSDGQISNYSWSVNGEQIAWTKVAEFIASIGNYTIALTVTDNDGATDTDTLKIEVRSLLSTEIWLEAECGIIGETWEKVEDSKASNGFYIAAPIGTVTPTSASTETADIASYTFHVPEAGMYNVWGRVITPTANDDSYYIQMDNSEWVTWNSIPGGNDWHWDDVHNGGNSSDPAVIYQLDTGYHTLNICFREDGALLDKIGIFNTGLTPVDTGGEANNCEFEPKDTTAIKSFDIGKLDVFPNPVSNQINIFWEKGFNSFKVINNQGQKVFVKQYAQTIEQVNETVNLNTGVYLLILQNNKTTAIRKLIVE